MSEQSGKMEIHLSHDLSSVDSMKRINRVRPFREHLSYTLKNNTVVINKNGVIV